MPVSTCTTSSSPIFSMTSPVSLAREPFTRSPAGTKTTFAFSQLGKKRLMSQTEVIASQSGDACVTTIFIPHSITVLKMQKKSKKLDKTPQIPDYRYMDPNAQNP